MADAVKGDNIVLFLKLGSNYYPLACARDVSITTTSDKIELAPYTSGKWRSYIYGRITGTISGTGITKVVPDSGKNSFFDLLDYLNSQTIILTKYTVTDPQGNTKTYEVPCLIDELNLSGAAGQLSNFSFQLTMNGDPSFEQTSTSAPLTDVDSYDFTAVGGETTISNSVLIGVDILDVRRNGIGLQVITVGTPTGSQVKFTSGSGSLEFGFALGADEYINVIYVS
jgi:hypothetical protein